MSYTVFFMTVAMIMLVSLLIFMLTVKEVKWAAEAEKINDELDGVTEEEAEKHTLSKKEKRSLLFILASVVLWFMGYNAVTSKYSVYAGDVLGLDFNLTLIHSTGGGNYLLHPGRHNLVKTRQEKDHIDRRFHPRIRVCGSFVHA